MTIERMRDEARRLNTEPLRLRHGVSIADQRADEDQRAARDSWSGLTDSELSAAFAPGMAARTLWDALQA